MSEVTINVSKLAATIESTLKEYTAGIEEGLQKDVQEVAAEAADRLKASSPRKTGVYASGWTKAKDGENTIVKNRTKPHITMLLENGHAKRNGGRVSARVHIAPVEEWAAEELEQRTERGIGGEG